MSDPSRRTDRVGDPGPEPLAPATPGSPGFLLRAVAAVAGRMPRLWLRTVVGDSRVLAYPRATKRRESWQSREGMAEDLIDMLLLARCEALFASYLSTFSETAWWLGGARAKVAVF